MIDTFVSMGITFFEAICVVIFFDCFLVRKRDKHRFLWLLAISGVIVLLSSVPAFIFHSTESFVQIASKFVSITLCYTIVCWLSYRVKFLKSLILSAIIFLLIYFTDYIGLAITDLATGQSDAYMQANIPTRLFYVMIYKAALFLILMIIRAIRRRISNDDTFDIPEMYMGSKFRWSLYFLMPALCIISIAGIFNLTSNEQHSNPLLLLLAIGWLFMCFVVFFFLQTADKHEAKYRVGQIIEQNIKTELEGLKAIAIVNENYHEYQNDLICIKNYLSNDNPEMALNYIDKLPYFGMLSAPKIRTGNEVVDAIVNQKYWLARNRQIHILPVLSNLTGLDIEDRDLVAIISNMLDNAIEACETVDAERVIHLKIVKESNNLIIAVKNPITAPIAIINGRITTSKQDKHLHGYGLRSIKRALDKYGSCYSIKADETHFIYSAVVPL